MTAKEFSVPQLDYFMKYHLYIGYCQRDKTSVQCLCEVAHTLGLTCCLRSSVDALELSVRQNIHEGINSSQRCLLYISSAYIDDCSSTYELQEAEKKVKYLGKKAVVAVIEPSVNQCHLKRFSEFTQINLERDQPIFTEACFKEFLSEFVLKPTLSTIPKSNIGVGVAITYFYGFLQLQIPGFTKHLRKAVQPDTVDWNWVVKKLLIIIPESVNSPPKLAEPGSLEQTNWTVKQFACRSGREMREYSVPVFKLTPVDVQQSYYFVGDIPACLFSLREAYDRGSSGLSKSELYQARNEFCITLNGLLNHPDNLANFSNQWEMLFWPDAEENPNRKKLSEFLYQQINAKQLTEVVQVPIDGPVQATAEADTYLRQSGIKHSTVYRDFDKYHLKCSNRGCCVIINNSTFSVSDLVERTGADIESSNLEELFSDLHFEVYLHKNLTATEMRTCLESYQRRDHSTHDAFICCILSHGMQGSVCATDGNRVPILSLMELFYDDVCPSLQGKPKLFFIGACQTEAHGGESAVQETGTKLIADACPEVADACPNAVDRSNLVPSQPDFIVSYATLPKKVAFAHPDHGGLYIQALCKILKEDYEIDMALKMVGLEVKRLLRHYSQIHNENYTVQEPFHMCLSSKSLFLCAEM